jgi:hypothetical protein
MFPNRSLAIFPVVPDQSACNEESSTSCTNDSAAPVRSSRIATMESPAVDYLKWFITAWGVYLTAVRNTLIMPTT